MATVTGTARGTASESKDNFSAASMSASFAEAAVTTATTTTMTTTSQDNTTRAIQTPEAISDRVYSEPEIQLECQGRYDQDKFYLGYLDEEFFQQYPHRYITNWSLKVKLPASHHHHHHHHQQEQQEECWTRMKLENEKQASSPDGWTCVPLPEQEEFLPFLDEKDAEPLSTSLSACYPHAVLEGFLLRNPRYASASATAGVSVEPLLPVRITHCRYISLQVSTKRERGYWLTTTDSPHAAQYWLQEPSLEQAPLHLERRALLGLLSNVVDCCCCCCCGDGDGGDGSTSLELPWFEQTPEVLHRELFQKRLVHGGVEEEPFSLELLRYLRVLLAPKLLQAFGPGLTPRSKFYQQLLLPPQEHDQVVPRSQLLQLCQEAEIRSHQHPWGGPLIRMTTTTTTTTKTTKTKRNPFYSQQDQSMISFSEFVAQDWRKENNCTRLDEEEQEYDDDDDDSCVETGHDSNSNSNPIVSLFSSTLDRLAQKLKQTTRYAESQRPRNRRLVTTSNNGSSTASVVAPRTTSTTTTTPFDTVSSLRDQTLAASPQRKRPPPPRNRNGFAPTAEAIGSSGSSNNNNKSRQSTRMTRARTAAAATASDISSPPPPPLLQQQHQQQRHVHQRQSIPQQQQQQQQSSSVPAYITKAAMSIGMPDSWLPPPPKGTVTNAGEKGGNTTTTNPPSLGCDDVAAKSKCTQPGAETSQFDCGGEPKQDCGRDNPWRKAAPWHE